MRRMSAASPNLRHRAFVIPGLSLDSWKKIPYLTNLGITAVELLPVFDFDETAGLRVVDGKPVRNFWGYSTVGYFALHSSYCLEPESGSHLREFRNLVKAMHKAGIEVILDVVFNPTDEGNHQGPNTLSKASIWF
jgi:isoamylase